MYINDFLSLNNSYELLSELKSSIVDIYFSLIVVHLIRAINDFNKQSISTSEGTVCMFA